MNFRLFLITGLWLSIPCCTLWAQPGQPAAPADSPFYLVHDTLFSNAGFYICKGQQLMVGNPSGNNGWYRSIGFASSMAWPIWLFHDAEISDQYAGRSDPEQERNNDKLASLLDSGVLLTVRKFKKRKNKQVGTWYWVYLSDKRFPGTRFMCNIQVGLQSKEIVLP